MEYVSIWDFYPDPDARNMPEAEFSIQRHRLNRSQLRNLKKRPHFREESIELALEHGADYTREYWEDSLEDDSINTDMLSFYEKRCIRMTLNTHKRRSRRYSDVRKQ